MKPYDLKPMRRMSHQEVKRLIDDQILMSRLQAEYWELLNEIEEAVVALGDRDEGERQMRAFICVLAHSAERAFRAMIDDSETDQEDDVEGSEHLEQVGPEVNRQGANLQGRVVIVPADQVEKLKDQELETLRRHYGPHVAMCPELDQ